MGHTRPMIGITAQHESARWGDFRLPATLLPQAYAECVAAAGGAPVLLPCVTGISDVAARLDGLILAGGGDVDPARYDATPGPHTHGVSAERDTAEFALLDQARAAGIPILGICRGMQLINVALGGSLHQHLPDVVHNSDHRQRVAVFDTHRVKVDAASRLATALGWVEADVRTYHHQAVDRLGSGVEASAWATDGTVEAIELPHEPDVLGVQWHPEMGDELSLFAWVVARAA